MSEVISPESASAISTVTFELSQPAGRRKLALADRAWSLVPYIIVYTIWLAIAFATSVIAWFAILITGQYPRGLFNVTASAWRCMVRINAYALLLVDRRPPFSGAPDPSYALDVDITPLPEYNRLLTLFRFPLLIPLYLVTVLAELAAFVAWIPSLLCITFIRHQPNVLQRILANFMYLWARFFSSAFLMTETLWVK